jgi:hypothetical protein
VRLRNGRRNAQQTDPSLFAIEQIVEDTLFLCEIRGSVEEMRRLASDLAPVLIGDRWLRLGRAGAPVEVAALEWSDNPSAIAPTSRGILTLTSDLLARDEALRWRTMLDEAAFLTIPGWPRGIHVKPVIQDAVDVHGFNGTSRLWRMPASGIRRGSVFELEGDAVPELYRMMGHGRWLGERTHEGFGRFRVDAKLPGLTDGRPDLTTVTAPEPDDPQEAIAATTRDWFESHRTLAAVSSDRRPSLSQWLDLVGALERNESDALTSRQKPITAGARSWLHRDASEILRKLAKVQESNRATHARLFVRWLRAEMHREVI